MSIFDLLVGALGEGILALFWTSHMVICRTLQSISTDTQTQIFVTPIIHLA